MPFHHILFFILFSVFSFSSCQHNSNSQASEADTTEQAVPPTSAIDYLIVAGKKVGAINAHSTEADIIQHYGADNTTVRPVHIGEEETKQGIVVFPETNNEIEIIMDVAAATGTPEFVRISKEKTSWKTQEGITIGTSVNQLAELNGRPFPVYGFEWDYGGLVPGWDGGNLSNNLIIVLIPQKSDAISPTIMGDHQIQSNNSALLATEPTVGSMVITFEK